MKLNNSQALSLKHLLLAIEQLEKECNKDDSFKKYVEDMNILQTIDSLEEMQSIIIDHLYPIF